MIVATATTNARMRYVWIGLSSGIVVVVVVSGAGRTKFAGSIRVGWGAWSKSNELIISFADLR